MNACSRVPGTAIEYMMPLHIPSSCIVCRKPSSAAGVARGPSSRSRCSRRNCCRSHTIGMLHARAERARIDVVMVVPHVVAAIGGRREGFVQVETFDALVRNSSAKYANVEKPVRCSRLATMRLRSAVLCACASVSATPSFGACGCVSSPRFTSSHQTTCTGAPAARPGTRSTRASGGERLGRPLLHAMQYRTCAIPRNRRASLGGGRIVYGVRGGAIEHRVICADRHP